MLCGRKARKRAVPHLGRTEIAAFAEFDLFFFISLMSHMYKEGACLSRQSNVGRRESRATPRKENRLI